MSGPQQTPAQKEAASIRTLSRVTGLSVSQIRHGLREFQRTERANQNASVQPPAATPATPLPPPAPVLQSFSPIPFRLDEKVLERGREDEKTGPMIPTPPETGFYGLTSTDGVLQWTLIAACST